MLRRRVRYVGELCQECRGGVSRRRVMNVGEVCQGGVSGM